jgi:hypothetical protein
MELPSGVYGRWSGLALKHGITIGARVINYDYMGNILIFNQAVSLLKGYCIAQLIPEWYFEGTLKEVNQIHNTERNTSGFGSTNIAGLSHSEIELFAIDLMAMATKETLRKLIPSEYHDYLDVFDPEGSMKKLPPL